MAYLIINEVTLRYAASVFPLLFKRKRHIVFTVCATLMLVGQARPDPQQSCVHISQVVRICGTSDRWDQVQKHSHAAAEFRRKDGFYAQVIRDTAGRNQGLTLKDATDAIIQNAEKREGSHDFALLMRGTNHEILDSEIIVFKVEIGGIPFVFADTVYVGRDESIQLITWRIAREPSIEDRSAHLDFGKGLVLMPSF